MPSHPKLYEDNPLYSPLPKDARGYVDKKILQNLYFNSPHMEWKEFCKEYNFDHTAITGVISTKRLTQKKRQLIAEKKIGDLKEMIENHKVEWHKNVLETMQKYPALADRGHAVISAYWAEVAKEIQKQKKREELGEEVPFKDSFVYKWSPYKITALAQATKNITEAKHRSLLIDNWSVKQSEDETANKTIGNDGVKPISFEIIGTDNMTKKQIAEYLAEVYDKPVDIEAELSGEEIIDEGAEQD